MAGGNLLEVGPDAWTIRDGKLLLNCSDGVRRRWPDDLI